MHVLDQRVVERLEFDHELDFLRRGVVGELAAVLGDGPKIPPGEDLQSQKYSPITSSTFGPEVGVLVDVRLAAVEREALHGGNEIDEAEPIQTAERIGRPSSSQVPLIARRSSSLVVSGSSKTS